MASKISAVIITQNEERNIGRCLESLSGIVDETVVVDSGSTDETKEICEKYGARFMHHDWKDYADQKNYANSLVNHEWTLSIDADEALSDQLRESISELKKAGLDGNCTYSMARLNNYCGSWIRHSGWYPDEKVRLWPSGACTWEGLVHEELKYAKAMENRKLEGDLLHKATTIARKVVIGILRDGRLGNLEIFLIAPCISDMSTCQQEHTPSAYLPKKTRQLILGMVPIST